LSPRIAAELQHWLNACRERLSAAPASPRLPLCVGEHVIGSVHPDLWARLGAHWPTEGDASEALALLANHLRTGGLAGVWRNEQVAVRNASGVELAAVERGVVRVLGISAKPAREFR
jgi:hypothetical protein